MVGTPRCGVRTSQRLVPTLTSNFMNEKKPKSIWKKSLKLPGLLLLWLILMMVTMLVFVIVLWCENDTFNKPSDFIGLLIFGAVVASILLCLWLFVRWIFHWRNFKRFLFGLVCFITLIALFYAEENWRGKHDWNKFKREWEAKGEKFDRASVIPPAVPDEQNFALTPIVFTSYGSMLTRDGKLIPYKQRDTNFVDRLTLNVWRYDNSQTPTNGNWMEVTVTDLKSWQDYYRATVQINRNATTNEFPIAPQPQTPARDVLLALSKYDSAIEELRQASQLPYSRFPLQWNNDDPAAILLPHLAGLKRCSQVLQLRAIAELQNGESEKALADIKLSLRLADSIRTEPILISQLVRIAILRIMLQPIYEGLAEHKWSDAQLVTLDTELAKLDFLANYKLAMRGEMVFFQSGIFDYLRRHPSQIFNYLNYDGEENQKKFIPSVLYWLIPTGWFYQNQLNCARPMVEFYLPAADVKQQTISPAKIRAADEAIDAETKHPIPNNFIERLLLPAQGASAKKFSSAQSSVNLARVAITLERYRLTKGSYPESLAALAPKFISEIPHDVINGEPLHYRKTDDGQFILYSVGWNERDDGGVVVFTKGSTPTVDINEGDWVWKYPQK